MHNKSLAIFYCGTNGAGKSTLRSFNRDSVQIVIDSDHIAMQINPDNPRLADIEAGRKAIELFKFAIRHNISFSMESTLSGTSILQRMEVAKKNFYTRLNYVGVDDPKINIARVKARVKAGGHFIDEETIKRRYQISRENLIQAILLNDETFIYDNSSDSPKIQLVISANKTVTKLADKLPQWCEDLVNELLMLGYTKQSL
ncbi:zeta toxin family protein [Glaesserella parasuis]|uniref:zeta toxin family protein n=1 Tax=Glaesserella parasuis TaxID=738 RepID=UPI0021BDB892|nr:zeta toxin family protein [Glaesserella parasuis]MCT8518353.1 zeta toxin family protein [Glaesserella parasuis]MCT8537345.1 zeta toxin family protein [Glaesserella parasuis]MCT8549821.1 zeta toxin family protein [Glaesserella parasuis]MCT8566329.1 zeta toxin family protein [Glaesserella parasuis]MCT8568756.1 zeta toxin family protein [Glaesserella parasuis]